MPDVVILTGAGLSAESGLGTFRDTDGLWTRYDLNDVATPEGFRRNPELVHEFYNARRANCASAAPNAAHDALARLEMALGNALLIVTQNVDDLHERAGTRRVLHMHGQLDTALCQACGHRWPAPPCMSPGDTCPACARSSTRPDVVWFGEMPYGMNEIADALEHATHFVAIGTSGSVYPAAGFVRDAELAGARTLELNLERSEVADAFDETRQGKATEIVPIWVDDFVAEHVGTKKTTVLKRAPS